MKKKINLILLASSFALLGTTACSPAADNTSSSDDSSSVVDESKTLAESAWAGVATIYSAWSSDGLTGDQDLTTEAKKNSSDGTKTYEYSIAYSVASDYASNLKINDDGNKLLVTMPAGTDFKGKVHAKLTLKGASEVLYETDFNVLVKAAKIVTLADLYSDKVANKDYVSFDAIYIGMYPKQGAIFGAGENAILAYKLTDATGLTAGKAYSLIGQISDYSGLRELANVSYKALDAIPEGLAAPTTLEMDSANVRAFKFGDDNRAVSIKGAKVVSTYVSESKNLTVTLDLNGTSITAFMNATYSADVIDTWKQKRSGAEEATLVEAGDIVSFTGFVSAYSNVYQVVYGKVTAWKEAPLKITYPTTVLIGDTGTITVGLKDESTYDSVTYSSSDATIATVSDAGVVSGLKTGNVTITITVKVGDDTYTDTVTIAVFELTPVTKTVDELLGMAKSDTTEAVYDRTAIYQVKGILEGLSSSNSSGSSYLTDPSTGKSVKIYGLTGVKNKGFTFTEGTGDDAGYGFKNPYDAKTSLEGIKNGEEVTLNVLFEDYKGVANIMGSVVEHRSVDTKYTSTVTAGENGTANLSVTEASVYGTEIKVTASPNTGYKVDKVTVTTNVGTTTLDENEDGTYSYNVTCKNEVNVTFKVDDGSETVNLSPTDFDCTEDHKKDTTQTAKGITFEFSGGGTSGAICMYSTDIRLYSGGIMKISTTLGKLKQVVFTTTDNAKNASKLVLTEGQGYTVSTDNKIGTWASDTGADSISLKADGSQVRITAIQVTYIPSGNA